MDVFSGEKQRSLQNLTIPTQDDVKHYSETTDQQSALREGVEVQVHQAFRLLRIRVRRTFAEFTYQTVLRELEGQNRKQGGLIGTRAGEMTRMLPFNLSHIRCSLQLLLFRLIKAFPC